MKVGKPRFLILVILTTFTLITIFEFSMTLAQEKQPSMTMIKSLLSDPFLQLPTETTVNVIWFTDFKGDRHQVKYGDKLGQQVAATTTKLSRVREDQDSQLNLSVNLPVSQPTSRDIWRHEATVNGLNRDQRLPYQVTSIKDGEIINSNVFTLASQPQSGTPLKILLTSDHQLMPMTAANLQKVVETVGQVDGVFFAGDLVNIPDRASEWFDDSRGGAFFPGLQGRANYELETNGVTTIYRGGEIIQHAPLFTTIGNHEVMGRLSQTSLKKQFEDAIPRSVAAQGYSQVATQVNSAGDSQVKTDWIKNNSFNTDTYEEIFSLPQSKDGGKLYYATTFGDIRLISLYVTNIWRSPSLEPDTKGRYQESTADLERPEKWGYGQHIFEPIAKGSQQYSWLEQELKSEAYQQAKYKIVMFHHPPHTLGGNIVPPYSDPQAKIEYAENGKMPPEAEGKRSRSYEYPIEDDYIIRDLLPLLESAGVQFVYYGHSHLWNRFVSPSGMNFLESSNVGNSYGAHVGDNKRPVPLYSPENYAKIGDPNGLEAVMPTIAPILDESGQPISYIASNDITVFSILDTQTGEVSSYRYDTRKPNSAVIKFDEFKISN